LAPVAPVRVVRDAIDQSYEISTTVSPVQKVVISLRTMIFGRLLFDDRGQDLIEYALLSALIGIVGIIAWNNVGVAVNTTYTAWDTNLNGDASTAPWRMPDPIGGGS
jgi:Flp pilus assembly pilin Flp